MKFSANLGFLFNDRPLPDAVRASHKAGFDAVECHWPYDTPVADLRAALDETGLKMLGLNTRRGDVDAGDNGLCAIPDRVAEARASIDEALDYAAEINVPNVHVMSGFADGDAAHVCFVSNLEYACAKAAKQGVTILIEPLNPYDAPGYFLGSTGQAAMIIEEVGADNLKLMFDCYHVQLIEGDVCNRLKNLLPIVGHVQFASVPDRGTPDHGELNYEFVFERIAQLGWQSPVGAEYKTSGPSEDHLSWLGHMRG